MDELIKNMTKSLRQYNSAANQAVIGINKSFVVVGYIIVSFFLLVEMMSWYKYLKQQGGELTYRLMFKVSYCILSSSPVKPNCCCYYAGY